jgi:2-phosphoglycerate kinase
MGEVRLPGRAEAADIVSLKAELEHVYWIGGGSGAGKSTIARRVAARHGLRMYSTDEAMADHDGRFRPEDAPLLSKFKTMDMDERWLLRSPQTMLESFHWFHGELFDLIVEDLVRFSPEPGVIAEGFRLLPRLLKPLLAQPNHAVWLLPTPEFRRAAFVSRGSLWQIAGKTSDPEKALDNLLQRDRMFTDLLRAETKRLKLPSIEIDTTMTEDDLTDRVAEIFGF